MKGECIGMPYISPDDILWAKKMDLLTYLKNYEPRELVKLTGDTYCTREHDSLKISNGKWHWFSRGIGGKSALDYLIKVQGYPFLQAVEIILGKAASRTPVFYTPKPRTDHHLLLPEKNVSVNIVVKYLKNRGVCGEVIDYCINGRLLYESKQYHNAVFVGYDGTGKARSASIRATSGQYKSEATGSDRRFSFRMADRADAAQVHVFESAIDAMSYATLLKMTGRNWQQTPLLSLSGVYFTKRENVVPIALEHFLTEHPKVQTVLLHLDNDEVGRKAAAGIIGGLEGKVQVIDSPPPETKDVNEYLMRRVARNQDLGR